MRAVRIISVLVLLTGCAIAQRQNFDPQIQRAVAPLQDRILQERGQVYQARGTHAIADAFFKLNQSVDEYARLLNKYPQDMTKPFAERSSYYLVSLARCEFSGNWFSLPTGYLVYAQAWPDGPNAEEAWLHALNLQEGACVDYEGTPPEVADGLKRIAEFQGRFPHSKHAKHIAELKSVYERDKK